MIFILMKEKTQRVENQVLNLIYQDFNVDQVKFNIVQSDMYEIKNRLIELIDYCLQNDFERLLNAMYRLDVNETKFKDTINGKYGNDVSLILAEFVIERELRKIETRNRYQGK